jgi:hypothetical protein
LACESLREKYDFLHLWNYDLMHTAFQDGFMSNAMWLCCSRISQCKYGNVRCESLVMHLQRCQVPKHRSVGGAINKLKEIFAPVMIPKHDLRCTIVANASMQLSLYALLRDWALEESKGVAEVLPDVCVYLAACKIIDLYRRVKHREISTQQAKPLMKSAIQTWLELHKVRYGTHHIKPKFCWLHLICARLSDSEWLFDMFCIERQHQLVRPHTEMVKNLVNWEIPVLLRVLDARICLLQNEKPNYCLQGREVQTDFGMMADRCICGGAKLSCDDIVKHSDGRVGVVLACMLNEGRLVLKIEQFRKLRAAWVHTSVNVLWSAKDVKLPIAWRQLDDGSYHLIE